MEKGNWVPAALETCVNNLLTETRKTKGVSLSDQLVYVIRFVDLERDRKLSKWELRRDRRRKLRRSPKLDLPGLLGAIQANYPNIFSVELSVYKIKPVHTLIEVEILEKSHLRQVFGGEYQDEGFRLHYKV